MIVEFALPGADALGREFLTWTPIEAQVRLLNAAGTTPVPVSLGSAGTGGRLRFATTRTHLGTPTLSLSLPTSGAPVRFFVAGEFGRASLALGDAAIEARGSGNVGVLGSKPVTVRVRKDANLLSANERDRFLAALATFNGGGSGRFRDFRDMHVQAADEEEYGNFRIPALASRIHPRPRAGVAGDRSERDHALLALRQAGAEPVHPPVHGGLGCNDDHRRVLAVLARFRSLR